jgi:hypothetical protein
LLSCYCSLPIRSRVYNSIRTTEAQTTSRPRAPDIASSLSFVCAIVLNFTRISADRGKVSRSQISHHSQSDQPLSMVSMSSSMSSCDECKCTRIHCNSHLVSLSLSDRPIRSSASCLTLSLFFTLVQNNIKKTNSVQGEILHVYERILFILSRLDLLLVALDRLASIRLLSTSRNPICVLVAALSGCLTASWSFERHAKRMSDGDC